VNARARQLQVPPAVLRRLATTNPARYPALLESAVAGPLGKVTILAAQPTAAIWSTADGRVHGRGVEPRAGNFLDALELWWRHSGTFTSGEDSDLYLARRTGVPFAPAGWCIWVMRSPRTSNRT
jgi:hypothetical protein